MKEKGNDTWQFLDKDDVLLRAPVGSLGWPADIWNPYEQVWEEYLGDDWDVFHNAGQITRKEAAKMVRARGGDPKKLDDRRVE